MKPIGLLPEARAPLPLGYKAAKRLNPGQSGADLCTLNVPRLTYCRPFLPFWSGVVRVKSIHPDQRPRAIAGPVRVVRVVRVKSNISHMCARAYVYLYFLHIVFSLTSKFEFVRNHPDHPDQINASLHSSPDRSPGPTRTTRTTPANTGIPEKQLSPARP